MRIDFRSAFVRGAGIVATAAAAGALAGCTSSHDTSRAAPDDGYTRAAIYEKLGILTRTTNDGYCVSLVAAAAEYRPVDPANHAESCDHLTASAVFFLAAEVRPGVVVYYGPARPPVAKVRMKLVLGPPIEVQMNAFGFLFPTIEQGDVVGFEALGSDGVVLQTITADRLPPPVRAINPATGMFVDP